MKLWKCMWSWKDLKGMHYIFARRSNFNCILKMFSFVHPVGFRERTGHRWPSGCCCSCWRQFVLAACHQRICWKGTVCLYSDHSILLGSSYHHGVWTGYPVDWSYCCRCIIRAHHWFYPGNGQVYCWKCLPEPWVRQCWWSPRICKDALHVLWWELLLS